MAQKGAFSSSNLLTDNLFRYLARVYGERKRNFVAQHFWARGYFVSTVGRDEEVIRQYIKNQEAEDKRLDQLRLWN